MRAAFLAVALSITASSLAAQQPEGARAPGERRPMMNPMAVQGPPEPAEFAKAVGLTTEQQPKYANLRQAYMKETKAQRDSIEMMRAAMRATMAEGGGRSGMASMRPLAEQLNARYEEFEASLGFLLTPLQQAKYDAWKEGERQKLMEQMRQRRGAAGARPTGGR